MRDHSRFKLAFAGALLLAAPLSGCGSDAEPATPEAASTRLQATLPGILDAAARAQSVFEDPRFAELGATVSVIDTLTGSDMVVSEPLARALEDDTGESVDLQTFLEETVFTEENHEGDGVYLLGGDDLCDELDPDCAEQVDSLELRVTAELAGDGLDIAISIGPDRHTPVELELRTTRLAATLDLGETAAAAAFVAVTAGEPLELPDTLEGKIRGSLELESDDVVTIEGAILEAVQVAGSIEGENVEISLAARDPLAALTVDLVSESVDFSLDLGPVTAQLPYTLIDELGPNEPFRLDWQGLSMAVTLAAGDDALNVTNLGIGDGLSRVQVGDSDVLAVELNPDNGHRFDLSVTDGADGPRIAVSPRFDLSVYVDASVTDPAAPTHLDGDTYRVLFAGDSPTIGVVDTGIEQLLHIVSGELTIEATDAAPVVVGAGNCLYGDLPVEPGAHPVLGAMAGLACPSTSN